MSVVAGGVHTFLYIKGKDGEDKLYASGKNNFGQLGSGDVTTRRETWIEVTQPEEFTIENDMMTPTLKVRRFKVKEKYQDQLEGLY